MLLIIWVKLSLLRSLYGRNLHSLESRPIRKELINYFLIYLTLRNLGELSLMQLFHLLCVQVEHLVHHLHEVRRKSVWHRHLRLSSIHTHHACWRKGAVGEVLRLRWLMHHTGHELRVVQALVLYWELNRWFFLEFIDICLGIYLYFVFVSWTLILLNRWNILLFYFDWFVLIKQLFNTATILLSDVIQLSLILFYDYFAFLILVS